MHNLEAGRSSHAEGLWAEGRFWRGPWSLLRAVQETVPSPAVDDLSLAVDVSQEKAHEQMQGCGHAGKLRPPAMPCVGHIRETYFIYSINSVCVSISVSQRFYPFYCWLTSGLFLVFFLQKNAPKNITVLVFRAYVQEFLPSGIACACIFILTR